MNLTENFTLEEMVASHTATELRLQEQFAPPQQVIDNLRALCQQVLEPARVLAGCPLPISSGYRCPALNKAVKGSSTSQHMKGQAADINMGSRTANRLLYEAIKNSAIVWDQMIWEYGDEKGPDWVHISFTNEGKNRKQTIRVR